MEVIGKTINFIKLHDFLDRIETGQVYSTLHTMYTILVMDKKPNEEFEFEGRIYTKASLLSVLKEENGYLEGIVFKATNLVKLQFASGNEIVIKIKSQEQFLQIIEYLAEA